MRSDDGNDQEGERKNANGDLVNLEELFLQTNQMIYNLGYRFFGNREEAMDFSQEVYMQAIKKKDTFKGLAKTSTWLYSIALNIGLNKMKRKKILQFLPIEHLNEKTITESQKPDSKRIQTFIQELENKEDQRLIYQELNLLDANFRIPLLLYYYEKMSYREISKKLEIKENTLKSYMRRGKMILAHRLTKRMFHFFS